MYVVTGNIHEAKIRDERRYVTDGNAQDLLWGSQVLKTLEKYGNQLE